MEDEECQIDRVHDTRSFRTKSKTFVVQVGVPGDCDDGYAIPCFLS